MPPLPPLLTVCSVPPGIPFLLAVPGSEALSRALVFYVPPWHQLRQVLSKLLLLPTHCSCPLMPVPGVCSLQLPLQQFLVEFSSQGPDLRPAGLVGFLFCHEGQGQEEGYRVSLGEAWSWALSEASH